jgi:hypothetical protein
MDVDWHAICRQLLVWIDGVKFWLFLICMTMFPEKHIEYLNVIQKSMTTNNNCKLNHFSKKLIAIFIRPKSYLE